MALAKLYLLIANIQVCRIQLKLRWHNKYVFRNFLVYLVCCCNHLTNFKFSGSNWKSNCIAGTFSKIYLCNRFAVVTCCSNQVTDYSTFQDPRETLMPQEVPFAKLIILTALLLQPVALIALLATQLFRIEEKLQCHNRYLLQNLFV